MKRDTGPTGLASCEWPNSSPSGPGAQAHPAKTNKKKKRKRGQAHKLDQAHGLFFSSSAEATGPSLKLATMIKLKKMGTLSSELNAQRHSDEAQLVLRPSPGKLRHGNPRGHLPLRMGAPHGHHLPPCSPESSRVQRGDDLL